MGTDVHAHENRGNMYLYTRAKRGQTEQNHNIGEHIRNHDAAN